PRPCPGGRRGAKARGPAAPGAPAADPVERAPAAGLPPGRGSVAEYGSPHGASWLEALARRGLKPVGDGEPADVVLDCFGLMHCSDQSAALAGRAARVNPGGVLLLQYHSLGTIIRCGQWNALRHGHYAYYSTTALAAMLAASGYSPRMAWQFGLYGGTGRRAASGDAEGAAGREGPVQSLLADDPGVGVRDPAVLAGLQRNAHAHAQGLHDWLAAQQSAGRTVLGYGAASRAVALLRLAGVDRALLPPAVEAS